MQQQQFLIYQQQHAQQMNQPRPRQPEPLKVKLKVMWPAQIRSLFAVAESQFNTFAVMEPLQRFDLIVLAITDDARMHARAVIENPDMFRDPYLALKHRLLEVYQPSVWQLAAEFLQHKELGDCKPSDMLDEMLALLPADLTVLVKAAFLGRLPADMRKHVQQGAEAYSYQQLAARADEIWQARKGNAPAQVAAAVTSMQEEAKQVDPDELEQVLAAVRFARQQPRGNSRAQHPSGPPADGQQAKKPLCRHHEKFGNRAYRCHAPATCQFTKN